MPLYEYDCPTCDHGFELLVRMDENPNCPVCGGAELVKRLSVPAKPAGGRTLPVAAGCSSMGPPCGAPSCCRLPENAGA